MTYLSWLLMWFKVVSGLRINLEKSKLIPMGRVDNFDDLAMEFGCRVGSLPCTYLGLPLGAPFKSIDSLEWSEGAVPYKVCYVEETIYFQRRENDPNSKHIVELTHLFYVIVVHAKLN